MSFRHILSSIVFLICSCLAHAANWDVERAWVEDPTGNMTLTQAQQVSATPLDSKLFTQGFSQSAYWFRLRIDPQKIPHTSANDKLIIRIRPPYQDQVQLFDPMDKSDRPRLSGDYFDWASDEYRSLNLNFVIPVGEAPRDVWLRLRTNQGTLSIIEVMTEDEVRNADRRQEFLSMLYLMVLLLCMGWGVMSYLTVRDRLVGQYILREIFAISFALVILGYFRIFASGWLPLTWLDISSNVIMFVFLVYVFWFDTQLIREFRPNRWLIRLLLSFMGILPLNLLLIYLGKIYWANVLTTYVVIVAIPITFLCVLSTRIWDFTHDLPPDQKPVFSKTFLVLIYGAVLLAVILNRLPVMGLMDAHEGFLYFNLVYAVLSSISMMVLIQVRAARLNQRQQMAQEQLVLAEHAATQERAYRIEQSNFLKMLAHEMKTPLSVIRMAVGSDPVSKNSIGLISRAVSDMNNIIDRLLQVERLQDQRFVVRYDNFDLAALIEQAALSQLDNQRLQLKGAAPLVLCSDQALVRIAISNLFDNALKYSPPASEVFVMWFKQGEYVSLFVENQVGSSGLPDPNQVFDKYYRADRAHERTGSGLGLYLVHELLILLGGEIRFESTENTVRFTIDFPSKPAQTLKDCESI